MTKLTQIQAAAMASETQFILGVGNYYVSPPGTWHDIQSQLKYAKKNTAFHGPDWCPQAPAQRDGALGDRRAAPAPLQVQNATTLRAAAELYHQGLQPAVLNFANPYSPGGGWLLGARAQEEFLCRNSGLAACLRGQPLYKMAYKWVPPLFSDALLYSPAVPVIRDENGTLTAPWPIGVITGAAPNVRVIPASTVTLRQTFQRRWHKVLALAHLHGHRSVVLGAWGCGAFHNNPHLVAESFLAIWPLWAEAFTMVVFAIPRSEKDKNLPIFQEVLSREWNRDEREAGDLFPHRPE